MAAQKPDPEETSKAPESADEDTFLFMGTRIRLPSEPGTKPKPQEAQQPPPSAGQADLPTSRPSSGYHEPIQSSKSSFDLEPLARSSKSSSSSRIFILGGGLLLVAVLVLFVWHRFGSTEAAIFQAAKAGQLVVPHGASAFDYYQRLKTGGVSPVTKDRLKGEVLPKLSDAGGLLLKKIHDGADLTESEQDELVRIYEFAAGVDSQDSKLLARRAYAAAYRAASRKAEAEALASLREAFQSDSQWALPFRDVARFYARAGNYANAEYFYQQTLQLDPKWALPALELGKLALQHDRLAEAELAFRRAIEADPTLHTPWSQLGSLYEGQKRKVEAVAAYEKALQLSEQRASPQVEEIRTRLQNLK